MNYRNCRNWHWNTTAVPSRRGDSRGWTMLFAALLAAAPLVPAAHAQSEPQSPAKGGSSVREVRFGKEGSPIRVVYTVQFEGGAVSDFKAAWMKYNPIDNFLITPSAEAVRLPAFEVRDMALSELARSIAFLSQGALVVETVVGTPGESGNIWRVAGAAGGTVSQAVKMRAVAAPHLFATNDTLGVFLDDAKEEQKRMEGISANLAKDQKSAPLMGVQIRPLPRQRSFVLIGTDEGIAGMESLIKAAELVAMERAKETPRKF